MQQITAKMQQSLWFVKEEEKKQYMKFFEMFDKDKSGTLTVPEM